MKAFALVSALVLAGLAVAPALAMDDMSSMSSMPMGGKMASCSQKNPAVIVNTSHMTYMMDTRANRMAMKGMMDHDKFVCKMTAVRMGAKMKSGSMMMAPHGKM